MQDWIIEMIAAYGYAGIFLMIALENVFPPIPSEVILAFGGFMITITNMNIFGAVSAATTGSLLGAAILYLLGRKLPPGRVGKILHAKEQDIGRAVSWFERYQGKAVFFCRMVPLLRSLISIPAGMAGMPPGLFFLLTAIGSAIWNTVLICAGVFLGSQWRNILHIFSLYSNGVYIVFLLAILAGIVMLLRTGRKKA